MLQLPHPAKHRPSPLRSTRFQPTPSLSQLIRDNNMPEIRKVLSSKPQTFFPPAKPSPLLDAIRTMPSGRYVAEIIYTLFSCGYQPDFEAHPSASNELQKRFQDNPSFCEAYKLKMMQLEINQSSPQPTKKPGPRVPLLPLQLGTQHPKPTVQSSPRSPRKPIPQPPPVLIEARNQGLTTPEFFVAPFINQSMNSPKDYNRNKTTIKLLLTHAIESTHPSSDEIKQKVTQWLRTISQHETTATDTEKLILWNKKFALLTIIANEFPHALPHPFEMNLLTHIDLDSCLSTREGKPIITINGSTYELVNSNGSTQQLGDGSYGRVRFATSEGYDLANKKMRFDETNPIDFLKKVKELHYAQVFDSPYLMPVQTAYTYTGKNHNLSMIMPLAYDNLVGYINDQAPTPKKIFRLLNHVAIGLNQAHQAGVAIIDVKEENVLIRQIPLKKNPQKTRWVASVADFGFATPLTLQFGKCQLTSSVQLLGTYPAPEVMATIARIRQQDYVGINKEKIDVWGFGLMLTKQCLKLVNPKFKLNNYLYPETETKFTTITPHLESRLQDVIECLNSNQIPAKYQKLAQLAASCIRFNPADRPTMEDVVKHEGWK